MWSPSFSIPRRISPCAANHPPYRDHGHEIRRRGNQPTPNKNFLPLYVPSFLYCCWGLAALTYAGFFFGDEMVVVSTTSTTAVVWLLPRVSALEQQEQRYKKRFAKRQKFSSSSLAKNDNNNHKNTTNAIFQNASSVAATYMASFFVTGGRYCQFSPLTIQVICGDDHRPLLFGGKIRSNDRIADELQQFQVGKAVAPNHDQSFGLKDTCQGITILLQDEAEDDDEDGDNDGKEKGKDGDDKTKSKEKEEKEKNNSSQKNGKNKQQNNPKKGDEASNGNKENSKEPAVTTNTTNSTATTTHKRRRRTRSGLICTQHSLSAQYGFDNVHFIFQCVGNSMTSLKPIVTVLEGTVNCTQIVPSPIVIETNSSSAWNNFTSTLTQNDTSSVFQFSKKNSTIPIPEIIPANKNQNQTNATTAVLNKNNVTANATTSSSETANPAGTKETTSSSSSGETTITSTASDKNATTQEDKPPVAVTPTIIEHFYSRRATLSLICESQFNHKYHNGPTSSSSTSSVLSSNVVSFPKIYNLQCGDFHGSHPSNNTNTIHNNNEANNTTTTRAGGGGPELSGISGSVCSDPIAASYCTTLFKTFLAMPPISQTAASNNSTDPTSEKGKKGKMTDDSEETETQLEDTNTTTANITNTSIATSSPQSSCSEIQVLKSFTFQPPSDLLLLERYATTCFVSVVDDDDDDDDDDASTDETDDDNELKKSDSTSNNETISLEETEKNGKEELHDLDANVTHLSNVVTAGYDVTINTVEAAPFRYCRSVNDNTYELEFSCGVVGGGGEDLSYSAGEATSDTNTTTNAEEKKEKEGNGGKKNGKKLRRRRRLKSRGALAPWIDAFELPENCSVVEMDPETSTDLNNTKNESNTENDSETEDKSASEKGNNKGGKKKKGQESTIPPTELSTEAATMTPSMLETEIVTIPISNGPIIRCHGAATRTLSVGCQGRSTADLSLSVIYRPGNMTCSTTSESTNVDKSAAIGRAVSAAYDIRIFQRCPGRQIDFSGRDNGKRSGGQSTGTNDNDDNENRHEYASPFATRCSPSSTYGKGYLDVNANGFVDDYDLHWSQCSRNISLPCFWTNSSIHPDRLQRLCLWNNIQNESFPLDPLKASIPPRSVDVSCMPHAVVASEDEVKKILNGDGDHDKDDDSSPDADQNNTLLLDDELEDSRCGFDDNSFLCDDDAISNDEENNPSSGIPVGVPSIHFHLSTWPGRACLWSIAWNLAQTVLLAYGFVELSV